MSVSPSPGDPDDRKITGLPSPVHTIKGQQPRTAASIS